MKRLIAFALSALLLFSLSMPAMAEAEYSFTEEIFRQLDGSTSLVPLGQGIASVLLGIGREQAAGLIQFNRTTQSFRNLMDGSCRIVIAAEPKNEVFDEMRRNNFPYLMETIAKEALVFVVNESNPVNSLTPEQIRGIYSGAITNWKEVGGEDMPIEAFQRNPTAGSQVMMEKLVMDGTPMMDAPSTHVPMEMAGLIEAVRSYDNSANAIGYTVFYYAADMQMAKGLKLLKVDGVLPSVQSIQEESYPYINGYYCCISAQAEETSPERRLFDWLVSKDGQNLLSLEGYVPVSAAGEGPESNVRIDYTNYAPNGRTEASFTYFDCPRDHLEPSDAYGLIFPYSGADLYGFWENTDMVDSVWDYYAGKMQGFFNLEGQLITDPVYSAIARRGFTNWIGEDYFWELLKDGKFGFASKDGSFVSEFCYDEISVVGDWLICTRDRDAGTFDMFNKNLELVKTEKDFQTDRGTLCPMEIADGLVCGSICVPEEEGYPFAVMDWDGNVLMQSERTISLDSNGMIYCYTEDWGILVYNRDFEQITADNIDLFDSFYAMNDSFYYAVPVGGNAMILDRNGSLFDWNLEGYFLSYTDSCFGTCHNGVFTVYDGMGRELHRNVPAEWEYLGHKHYFLDRSGEGLVIHKLPEDQTVFIPDGQWAFVIGDQIGVMRYDSGSSSTIMLDKDLNRLPGDFGDLTVQTDVITGEEYICGYDSYGFSGEQCLMTLDAQTELFRVNGNLTVLNGHIFVTDPWAFRCLDLEGNVIFCYPYYGMSSGD